jgi:hypothetical protein
VNNTPNSLGNKNDNNISAKYRGIHPSYIGRIDINVCGNSDPGTSGLITPFCKTDGLYFTNKYEPEDFKYEFEKENLNYLAQLDKMVVDMGYKDLQTYFDTRKKFEEVNSKIKYVEKEVLDPEKMYIYINLDDDVDI